MRRSPWLRSLAAVLLVLYTGAQPATLCAVDCLLQRHGTHQTMHAGHHHETMPVQSCHSGAVGAATTMPAALTAIAGLPPSLHLAVTTLPETRLAVPTPILAPRTLSLQLDTPPPRG